MNSTPTGSPSGYFPAIVCLVCDSPIDALVGLCVPRDEAIELVTASWQNSTATCLLTTLDGGRPVAVLPTPEGRWAGCNAFLGDICSTPQEAARRLGKLLKRGRHGYVGHLQPAAPAR